MVKCAAIETFLDFTCITENAFEARLAFAFACFLVQFAMAAAHNTRIIIDIATIHAGACLRVTFLAIRTVQFAFITFVARPILIGTLAHALSCIPFATHTARILTLFALQSDEGVFLFAAAPTQLAA